MGWIVGVLVALGSLLSYMGIKNRKIRKLEDHNTALRRQSKRAEKEKDLQQKVNSIQEVVRESQHQQTQEAEELKATIPEESESRELSDEGKQSAAAISGHILDRYRKRMSDGSRD
jgi:Tfp pilus assembly protein PilN